MPKNKESLQKIKELSDKICSSAEKNVKLKAQLLKLIEKSSKMDKKEIINNLRKIAVNINV